MPSFLTQCPHCLTPFRVTETQLEAAGGQVRCGACLGIFSATSNRITLKQTPEEAAAASELAEPLPPDPQPQVPEAEQITAAIPGDAADTVHDDHTQERDLEIPLGDFDLDSVEDVEDDEEQSEDEYEDDDLPEPPVRRALYERTAIDRIATDKTALRQYLAEIEDDAALEPLDATALDTFAEEPVTLVAARGRHWLYGVALFTANLLFAGMLVLQYTRANQDDLSRNARLAPVMLYVCRVLDCPVQDRSQLSRLVSEQLLVRSHPRYAQALEVSFVFRNDASTAQPFPALELGFNDTNNQLLANRLFKPAEYLPPELQTSEMPAQSSLQITLELADPGSEAVNYTLAFRAP